ncbi:PLC-like phosphodiesterase [Exidia glandulosa HHB12029]|uniref:PLC-like phosphodiesterase n=1 Tax=Exidia glandulosa HHB12029 TaxID=1314781 RepID=A0A166A7F4_EXIGL|nr:PLC-like phosphodiesterase [Exidia glandulosa HHB12029]
MSRLAWSTANVFAGVTPPGELEVAPAVANHAGALFLLWQEKQLKDQEPKLLTFRVLAPAPPTGPVWDLDGSASRAVFDRLRVTQPPALVDVDDVLHLLAIDQSGNLTHLRYADDSQRFGQRALVAAVKPNATLTVASMEGMLICVVCVDGVLSWHTWISSFGWQDRGLLVLVGGAEASPAAAAPTLVQVGLTLSLIVPQPGKMFVEYVLDLNTRSGTQQQRPTSATDAVMATAGTSASTPSLAYAFVAYGFAQPPTVGYALSVTQFNLSTWQKRESLDKTCRLTPAIGILKSRILCFFVDTTPGSGPLSCVYRNVDDTTDSWMSLLSDTTSLAALTIPGTHDTCAYPAFMSSVNSILPGVQTQLMTVEQQLNAGIRFLDLRLRLDGTGALEMAHNFIPLGLKFRDVVVALKAFLASNPKETVLVSIKNEANSAADIVFETAFNAVYDQDGANLWYSDNAIPTLGRCRGKLVLIRRFAAGQPASMRGINVSGDAWPNNSSGIIALPGVPNEAQAVRIQDNFDFRNSLIYPTTTDVLKAKWASFDSLLTFSLAGDAPNRATLYLNFLSAAMIGEPRSIATGGYFSNDVRVEGLNQRLWNYLLQKQAEKVQYPKQRFGVIVLDFPELPQDLIQMIIRVNKLHAD